MRKSETALLSAQGDATPRLSVVLRALREAAGVSQDGWATRLGYGRRTIQHWEHGEIAPDADATESLIRLCEELQLFREYREGALAGYAVTPDWLRSLVTDGRLTHRSPSAPAGPITRDLPVHLTPFIGREREVAELRRLLSRREVRLLTLTGPGGVGKTRLALHAAEQRGAEFGDRLLFVALAAVTDAAHVLPTIAQVLGLQERTDQTLVTTLVAHLRQHSTLLIIDNFEHVVEAAPAITQLLADCPELNVMVTSRVALRLYGEREYPVKPLVEDDAVRLFVDRAQGVKPDFELAPGNTAAVTTICQRLDGLPLALELAAARVRVLTPDALVQHLERPLRALTGGARDLPWRQQTLRATLAWSHDLLDPTEQVLFRRVAVFAGGMTFDAVQATVGVLGQELLDGLESLTSKSLVYQHTVGGHARFAMLETLREFALEKLAESDDEATTRRAHARYYLHWLSGGEPTTFTRLPVIGDHISSWDEVEVERANLREAVEWCIKSGDLETGGWLVQKQFQFWHRCGSPTEGRALAEQMLALDVQTDSAARGAAYCTAGFLAFAQADLGPARKYLESGLALARALDEWMQIHFCLDTLARISMAEGDLPAARRLLDEELALDRDVGDPMATSFTLWPAGLLSYLSGDYATARSQWEEVARLGYPDSPPLQGLGHLALLDGDLAGATRLFYAAWNLAQRHASVQSKLVILGDLAVLALARGLPEAAARLLGARDQLFAKFGSRDDIATRFFYDKALAGVREASEADALSRAWTEGSNMSLDDAFEYAQSVVPPERG
jgi:predicted ATPase/DNA-binding XRE family transcriptional regulator